MRILERYIFKSALAVFFTCLFTFLFLYIIIDIFNHLDEILKQHLALSILGRYYLNFLPIIFVRVAPIAALLATLYTFGRMNRDNEIIAMRASGLSILQISRVMILCGMLLTMLVFLINDRFVPGSLILTEQIKAQMESSNPHTTAKPTHETITNLSMYGLHNRLFFINKFIPAENTIYGITILEHDEQQNIIRKVVANKGVFEDSVWRFYQSITYDFDESGQIKGEPIYMEEEIMTITETPQQFLTQRQSPELMSVSELDNYLWKLSKSGATGVIRNLKVEFYRRFTEPLTCVIIILLGIPFSLWIRKRATGLSSIGISLIIGFLYYVLNAISLAVGRNGFLPPFLSASLIHVVALSASWYLITKLP